MVKKHDALFQTGLESSTVDKNILEAITELRDVVRQSTMSLKKMDERVTSSEIRIDKLFLAFPQGDVDGHARYHQVLIDMANEKREMWRYIKTQTLRGLVWVALVGLGYAALHEMQWLINLAIPQKPTPGNTP